MIPNFFRSLRNVKNYTMSEFIANYKILPFERKLWEILYFLLELVLMNRWEVNMFAARRTKY